MDWFISFDGARLCLDQGDAYSFVITSADEFNRFQLWFTPMVITGVDEATESFAIYATDNMIVVENASGENIKGIVQLTDMAGRIVLTNDISITNGIGRIQAAGFANGVYAVIFVGADGQTRTSQKVVLGR